MKTGAAKVLLVGVLVLSPGIGVGAQGIPAGDAALAVPVSGKVAIVNEGRATTQLVAILYVAGVSTTQQYDVDITLAVLGVSLRGEASLQMSTRATGLVAVADAHAAGQARSVSLHGAAGDTMVSLNVDQPVQGFGSYDPAEATIHIRGTGGTGMFDGVNLVGDLKGFFRPTGTLYLSYPSTDAALNAVERGLAGNAALTAAERLEMLEQAKQALVQANPATFPPDDTTQALVTSTMQRNGTQVQVALRIVVPAGNARQVVKVVAVEPSGIARIVYQGSHAPGETVSASATGTPPFVVQVYVAGTLAKQITAPAQ
jgi:hypothetical protein